MTEAVHCCKICAEKYNWDWKHGANIPITTCDFCGLDHSVVLLTDAEMRNGSSLDRIRHPEKYDNDIYIKLKEDAYHIADMVQELGRAEFQLYRGKETQAFREAKKAMIDKIDFETLEYLENCLGIVKDYRTKQNIKNQYPHVKRIFDDYGI